MTAHDIVTLIKRELTALKSEQVALDNTYRYRWHSGTATFDILDDVERVRKRQVVLEDTLKIIEEFKDK